jgi:hypothetical protein
MEDAKVEFESCQIYGNGSAGVVSQQKGAVRLLKCEVHDNCEGILIQDTGSARVEQCDVYSNRSNGIFVGFDHMASAAIIDNKVHDNESMGILVANKGKVIVRGNIQYGNRGLPPQLPLKMDPKAYVPSRKHLRRMKKNESTIKTAMQEQKTESFFDVLLQDKQQEATEFMFGGIEKSLETCANCKAWPPTDKTFAECARCKNVLYCCKECQKTHWPQHKTVCQNKAVKHPSFLDPNVSI